MAGSDPTGNFNPATFRTQIRQAMQMGLPNTAGDGPIFRWIIKEQYPIADPAQRPYNWFAPPSGNTPAPIADLPGIDCAVEWLGDSSEGTPAGFENEVGVKITLLDVDQQTIMGHGGRMPDQILLKGETYNVQYVPAPQGLFNVDVWTIYAVAQDTA